MSRQTARLSQTPLGILTLKDYLRSMALVQQLSVENYKSVVSATLELRRVNVFIGKPNSGKSNLLEALALLGGGNPDDIKQITRAEAAADLFSDHEIAADIKVTLNENSGWHLAFNSKNGQFAFRVTDPLKRQVEVGATQQNLQQWWPVSPQRPIRYYQFAARARNHGATREYGFLQPLHGKNLAALLYSNKALRESISALFRSMGFRLEVRPQESQIFMTKEENDILFSYPFASISETLQRIVFFKAVLETNSEAVLIFDEPESNTFPFYTKYLAERIALDERNQFVLTTHNPYVLTSIIEKTPTQDLAVFITRMKDYRTEFHKASPDELSEMLGLTMDVFLDLDRFFPER